MNYFLCDPRSLAAASSHDVKPDSSLLNNASFPLLPMDFFMRPLSADQSPFLGLDFTANGAIISSPSGGGDPDDAGEVYTHRADFSHSGVKLEDTPRFSPAQTPLLPLFSDFQNQVTPQLQQQNLFLDPHIFSATDQNHETPIPATRDCTFKTKKASLKKSLSSKKLQPVATSRFKATELEFKILQREFAKNPFPNVEDRQRIADSLGMETKQVQFWFQNRRANAKKGKGFSSTKNL